MAFEQWDVNANYSLFLAVERVVCIQKEQGRKKNFLQCMHSIKDEDASQQNSYYLLKSNNETYYLPVLLINRWIHLS